MPGIRENRSRRSGATIAESAQPQTQQIVGRRQTKVDLPKGGSGLLSGLATALSAYHDYAKRKEDALAEAEHAENMRRIKAENQAQQFEGRKRALTGGKLSPEENQDLDYANSYASTKGDLEGRKAAEEYKALADEQDPDTTNWDEFDEEFLKSKLQNGINLGTGDPYFDEPMMAQIKRAQDKHRAVMGEYKVRQQIQKGREALHESITASVAAGTIVDDIALRVSDAEKLYTVNPEKALPDVAFSIVAAAKGNPKRSAEALQALQSTGYAEKFPQQFAKVQAALTSSYRDSHLLEADLKATELSDTLDAALQTGDMSGLITFREDLHKARGQYGLSGGKWGALERRYTKAISKMGEDTADLNATTGAFLGVPGASTDVTMLRENMLPMFAAHHIDPLDPTPVEIEYAGRKVTISPLQMHAKSGYVISEDMKLLVGRTMDQGVEGFNKVNLFVQAMEAQAGEDQALKYLPEAKRADYLVARDLYNTTTKDPTEIYQEVLQARSMRGEMKGYGWGNVFSNKENAANTGRLEVEKALKEVLGADSVDPALVRVAERYTLEHLFKNKNLDIDVATAATQVAKAIKGRGDLLPDAAGDKHLTLSKFPTFFRGEEVHTFGEKLHNPATGEVEDPVENFNDFDKGNMENFLANVEGFEGEVHVRPMPSLDAKGVYGIVDDVGNPLVVVPGQMFRGVKIPLDRDEAAEVLSNMKITRDTGTEIAGVHVPLTGTDTPDDVDPDEPFGWSDVEGKGYFMATYKVMPRRKPATVDEKRAARDAELKQRALDRKKGDEPTSFWKGSIADTAAAVFKDASDYILAHRRSQGTTAAAAGVSKPINKDEINSAETLEKAITEVDKDAQKQAGPVAFEPIDTPPEQTYSHRRYERFKELEANRLRAYDDFTQKPITKGSAVKGNITVGVGFNMVQKDALKMWRQAGLSKEKFDKVKKGEAKLTENESRRLFDGTIKQYEGMVSKWSEGMDLEEHERLAAVSLAYNAPSRAKEFLKRVRTSLKAGIDYLLHDSWNKNRPEDVQRGIKARRYKEALQFVGASMAHLLPDPEEYLK